MGRVRGVADDTFTELLQTESRGFKDIVIFENVTESYQNLPQKVRACAFVLCLCFNLCACALVYKYACGVAGLKILLLHVHVPLFDYCVRYGIFF